MRRRKPISVSKAVRDREPAIRCAYDKKVRVRTLNPNPRNPNKHGPEQLRIYAKVLRHQGFRKSITVSNQSGKIVTGEGAYRTCIAEGWEFAPVDYQDFKTPADEMAHLLADNRLPQLAQTDEAELAAILAQDLSGLDVELAGALAEPGGDELAPTPEYPITAKLLEQHDFILIFTDNATDFVFLQSLCGVRTEKSYKKTGIGTGRVVPFARFLEAIRENHHSLNVQGAHGHDPQARA